MPKTLTREHLWPASLHSRLATANAQLTNRFWLARLKKEIQNEPQIRDVCADCNNGVLSELDTYICRLFDRTLVRIRARHERVLFEHDYHPLKRWLLKLCFNSARIHDSRDRFALEAMVPYILGRSDSTGRSVQLFLQLLFPEVVIDESGATVLFEPAMNRVGHCYFQVHGVGKKLLRVVHLRSFSFYLAFYESGAPRAMQTDFADVFMQHMQHSALLRQSQQKVELVCDGVGAWTSFSGSRVNQLVSDNDA